MNMFGKRIPMQLFFSFFLSINAQQDNTKQFDFITDRPDATESPNVVPKGFFQIETGASHESFKEGDFKTEINVLNTTLLRYGFLENLEFRLGWDFAEEIKTLNNIESNNVLSGFSPLLLGMKVAITKEKKAWPEIGFLGHLLLPFTAGRDYKPKTTGANFLFAFSHSLNAKSNFSYNLGAEWVEDSSNMGFVYSTSYGYSIAEKIGIYAEVFGNIKENTGSGHYLDTGLTFLLRPNIQLDASVGKSIDEGQDIFLSGGVSFRIPN